MTGQKKTTSTIDTDLLIIGAGLAGLSAALFASKKNISTVVAGAAGGFDYASGLMDLWGLSLTQKNKPSRKPWDMHQILCKQNCQHPLARLGRDQLLKAFNILVGELKAAGVHYTGHPSLNHTVLTPFGTQHVTFRLPYTMKENAVANKYKPPCRVLDFRGLREFSARFFCEMVQKKWPDIEPGIIEFPGTRLRSEVFTPLLARLLETGQVQDELIKAVKPMLKGKTCLGIPAILGVQSCDKIWQRLQEKLGVSIFEIPTPPVSVSGMRLKEALLRRLENTCVKVLSNTRMIKVSKVSHGRFECRTPSFPEQIRIRSNGIILATGRFLSKGLEGTRTKIYEPLLGLPVAQPGSRREWHRHEYFAPEGHPINRAGIETDVDFRPQDRSKQIIHERLYAIGSILAHQDWVREKCGSSLSIGTAFKAVESFGSN